VKNCYKKCKILNRRTESNSKMKNNQVWDVTWKNHDEEEARWRRRRSAVEKKKSGLDRRKITAEIGEESRNRHFLLSVFCVREQNERWFFDPIFFDKQMKIPLDFKHIHNYAIEENCPFSPCFPFSYFFSILKTQN